MGIDKEVGTVEAGKRADLILLDANPLDDIHNIRAVRYVVANGVMYPTAKLWESVGFNRRIASASCHLARIPLPPSSR